MHTLVIKQMGFRAASALHLPGERLTTFFAAELLRPVSTTGRPQASARVCRCNLLQGALQALRWHFIAEGGLSTPEPHLSAIGALRHPPLPVLIGFVLREIMQPYR